MKLYYYKTEPNFGDLLNPLIVEALRGKTPRYARPSHCDSVFIGSLLHLFLDRFSSSSFHFFMRCYLRPTVHVWGTGLVNREAESITNKAGEVAPFCRKMKFYALRGKLTQAFVKEMGYDVDRVTLGDPGLLVARLLKPKPCDEAFSCAIIPHYTELIDLNRFEEYNRLAKKIPGSIIIDVRRPFLKRFRDSRHRGRFFQPRCMGLSLLIA